MPIYEYACQSCNKKFDQLVRRMSGEHEAKCPECGSTLIDEAEVMPNVTMIMAGTLDDASWVKPGMEIFCDSAQQWVELGGDRQRFPKMPG